MDDPDLRHHCRLLHRLRDRQPLMVVAEGHAVWASGNKESKGQWVELFQVGDDRIQLVTRSVSDPIMTPEQARYLASKLNRLASKIEGNHA